MSWVAVDDTYGDNNEYGGREYIFASKPERWSCMHWNACRSESIGLPKGSIKKLIGRDLTWNDEAVELK